MQPHPASVAEQSSGLAILRSTYESDKLDPDDVDFVHAQLELFATRSQPLDRSDRLNDTGRPSGQERR